MLNVSKYDKCENQKKFQFTVYARIYTEKEGTAVLFRTNDRTHARQTKPQPVWLKRIGLPDLSGYRGGLAN
jgi:hypothetical protein